MTRKTVSAGLLYGASVAAALALAAAPVMIDTDRQTTEMKNNLDQTCRDITTGKKESTLMEQIGCHTRGGYALRLR